MKAIFGILTLMFTSMANAAQFIECKGFSVENRNEKGVVVYLDKVGRVTNLIYTIESSSENSGIGIPLEELTAPSAYVKFIPNTSVIEVFTFRSFDSDNKESINVSYVKDQLDVSTLFVSKGSDIYKNVVCQVAND